MKKRLFVLLPVLFIVLAFTGCTPEGHSNLLLFTDRLNEISGEEILLEDYALYNGGYRLVFEKDGGRMLITAEENENGCLSGVSVTVAKVDQDGNEKAISEKEAALYRQKVFEVLYAFTLSGEEKSREAAEKILPLKGEDLLRTGELTTDIENYHLVYYSNSLCCRFTVTDNYIEKTVTTEKPVSRPLLQYQSLKL